MLQYVCHVRTIDEQLQLHCLWRMLKAYRRCHVSFHAPDEIIMHRFLDRLGPLQRFDIRGWWREWMRFLHVFDHRTNPLFVAREITA